MGSHGIVFLSVGFWGFFSPAPPQHAEHIPVMARRESPVAVILRIEEALAK
jgi:hypothetical protein